MAKDAKKPNGDAPPYQLYINTLLAEAAEIPEKELHVDEVHVPDHEVVCDVPESITRLIVLCDQKKAALEELGQQHLSFRRDKSQTVQAQEDAAASFRASRHKMREAVAGIERVINLELTFFVSTLEVEGNFAIRGDRKIIKSARSEREGSIFEQLHEELFGDRFAEQDDGPLGMLARMFMGTAPLCDDPNCEACAERRAAAEQEQGDADGSD